MQCICLRNCFPGDRLYKAGKVYEFPDNRKIEPKNFRAMEQAPELVPEAVQSTPEPEKKETNPLVCSECGKVCASNFGLKSHMRVHK